MREREREREREERKRRERERDERGKGENLEKRELLVVKMNFPTNFFELKNLQFLV